jgi:hypothetical protein
MKKLLLVFPALLAICAWLVLGCANNNPVAPETSGGSSGTAFFENFNTPDTSGTYPVFTGWIESDGKTRDDFDDLASLTSDDPPPGYGMFYVVGSGTGDGAYVYRPFTGDTAAPFSASFDFDPAGYDSDWTWSISSKVAFVVGFNQQVKAGVLYDQASNMIYALDGSTLSDASVALPGWVNPDHSETFCEPKFKNIHMEYNGTSFTVKVDNGTATSAVSTTAALPIAGGYNGFFFAIVAVVNGDFGHLPIDNVRVYQPPQAPSPAATPIPTPTPDTTPTPT